MISPCKQCENHSRIFPICFDKCNIISDFQNGLIGKPVEDFEDLTQDCLYKYEGVHKINNLKALPLEVHFN
jgi:hypothetical protein